MNYISYNKEILTAQAEMTRLFSNIAIYNPSTKANELVPCTFGQASRILKALMNPTAAPQIYPTITVERGNLSIDLSRNSEIRHDTRIIPNPSRYDPNMRPPTPINITFDVKGFTKYPEQCDMIVSNFVPFFNKDVYVVSPHPKIKGRTLAHQVVWDGNVKYDWRGVLQNTEQDVQSFTTTFTYKTELFGGTDFVEADWADSHGRIITINMSLSPSDGSIYPKFDKDHPNQNLVGGFFAVPYSKDFEEYSDGLVNEYILHGEGTYDNYFVTNAYNCQFNTAVMNGDLTGVQKAASNGANIFRHSYWPYSYASANNMKEIVGWLEENGALVPNSSKEHYPDRENDIHVAENSVDKKSSETT